ncbi:MAG: hypothetical protein IJS89_08050 [Bacteroidaceae bacterium]|nr:hypothetical protein [Bacteroidaceae bacterium]
MKAHLLITALLAAAALTACSGNKTSDDAPDIDSAAMMEGSAEETQRFLDQEGDIIHDESLDTLPAPEDLPEEEDAEGDLPPLED